jgi:hypothetical protein
MNIYVHEILFLGTYVMSIRFLKTEYDRMMIRFGVDRLGP